MDSYLSKSKQHMYTIYKKLTNKVLVHLFIKRRQKRQFKIQIYIQNKSKSYPSTLTGAYVTIVLELSSFYKKNILKALVWNVIKQSIMLNLNYCLLIYIIKKT